MKQKNFLMILFFFVAIFAVVFSRNFILKADVIPEDLTIEYRQASYFFSSVSLIFVFSSVFISIFYFLSSRHKFFLQNTDCSQNMHKKISVIIPARNEEINIKKVLNHLINQSVQINQIIVVNDNSSDRTAQIVEEFSKKYENIKLINLSQDPPEGWTGKSWALWNGAQHSCGDLLVFIDADVELGEKAIEALVEKQAELGGVVSIWPYQRMERFYEHLNLVMNLLVVYAGGNLGFFGKKPSGLFGPVVLTTREDYFETGGHQAIKDSVLEDIKLGRLYARHGKRITNLLGLNLVRFRMYPGGMKQLFEGFTKNMASGSVSGGVLNLSLAFLWMTGVYSSIFAVFRSFGAFLFYPIFAFIVFVLSRRLGDYKWYDFVFYPVHFLFFLVLFIVSTLKTVFLKQVSWRGRRIRL